MKARRYLIESFAVKLICSCAEKYIKRGSCRNEVCRRDPRRCGALERLGVMNRLEAQEAVTICSSQNT